MADLVRLHKGTRFERGGGSNYLGGVNLVLAFDSLDWLTNVLFDGWLANGIYITVGPEFVTL